MSLTAGSITCRAYRLADPPKGDFIAEAMRDVQRHAFKPCQTDKAQVRSMGWVNPRNLLDSRLSEEKTIFEDFLVLGLRVDKISLNSRIVKATFEQAMHEVMKERRVKALGREEKAALLEEVKLGLIAKQTPSTSLYEMAWNMTTSHVYFSATSETLNQEFCDLFGDTFHTGLTPMFPFLRAEAKAKKEGLTEALLESVPAVFARPTTVREAVNE